MSFFSKGKSIEISGFFLLLLALFPILRPAVQSILILLFALSAILLNSAAFPVRIRNRTVRNLFWIFTAYYLWHFLSLLWSDDKTAGINMLQSSLVLFIFPVIFLFFHPNLTSKIRNRIEGILIISMLLLAYFWYAHYLDGVSHFQVLRLQEAPVNGFSFREQLSFFIEKGYYWISGSSIRGYRLAEITPKLFLHHGYLAAYFVMAFLSALRVFGRSKKVAIRIGCLLAAGIFLIFISYLPSVMNKLALLITTPLVIWQYLSKKFAWGFVVVLGLTGLIYGGINFDSIKSIKWVEKENVISKEPVVLDYFRYHVYSCAAEKAPEHFMFGMGSGDVQNYLNQCLPDKDWPGLSETRRLINTHSQFLHYFMTGGLIGLILFLLLGYKLFAQAISKGHVMVIVVGLIVLLNCIFENFLSRIWGAFFFMYFIFLYLPLDLPPNASKNDESTH